MRCLRRSEIDRIFKQRIDASLVLGIADLQQKVRIRVCERAPPLDENHRRDDQSKQNAPTDNFSRREKLISICA